MFVCRSAVARVAAAGACFLLLAAPLRAQEHEGMPGMGKKPGGMMTLQLGVPMDRMGSGTTWIPDGAPIASVHRRVAGWDVTGHGLVFAQYIHQGGPRGDKQFGSLNWGMLMASRGLAGGLLQLRTMLSLDPASVTARGYPSLLQTGETYRGEQVHDRQHPHDFWMELGALYQRRITPGAAVELYAAPSGEPALGPVAFMHRPSAIDDPIAPLSHHWQDATHISFGVVTAGIFSRHWKLEGSLFNGREPDEHRWGFDFDKLDSYSGRLTHNPSANWSLTAGYGRLNLDDDETLHRLAASILHGTTIGSAGRWASTLVYAANIFPDGGGNAKSVLLESAAVFDRSNTLLGRFEFVQKSAAELGLMNGSAGFPAERRFDLGMASLGYIREVVRGAGVTIGLGVRGSLGFVPGALAGVYGSRNPVGGVVFLRLRPDQ